MRAERQRKLGLVRSAHESILPAHSLETHAVICYRFWIFGRVFARLPLSSDWDNPSLLEEAKNGGPKRAIGAAKSDRLKEVFW